MDLENQRRVKELAEKYGAENCLVLLGASEAESAALAAETVTTGDPTFAGPLAGVQPCAGSRRSRDSIGWKNAGRRAGASFF